MSQSRYIKRRTAFRSIVAIVANLYFIGMRQCESHFHTNGSFLLCKFFFQIYTVNISTFYNVGHVLSAENCRVWNRMLN